MIFPGLNPSSLLEWTRVHRCEVHLVAGPTRRDAGCTGLRVRLPWILIKKGKLRRCAGLFLVVVGLMLRVVANPAQIEAGVPAQGQRILRLARPTDPQTLDMARVLMAADMDLMPLLNRPLIDQVGGTNIVNCAAQSWSGSADARVYTFHLRPGLKFSNGRPVVAADYAYALARMLDPQTASFLFVYCVGIHGAADFVKARQAEQEQRERGDKSHAGWWKKPTEVAGVRVLGADTLVIELDQPDPVFPYAVPSLLVAQPREEVERLGTGFDVRPVGDGPYVVKEWVRGVRLVLTPNLYYAGLEPRHFDRIEIMIGGDASTHLMMFERGELDIADIEMFTLPIPDYIRIKQDSRWRSYLEESRAEYSLYVSLNVEMPPLDNLKVRQALNYALDKSRCVRSANGRIEAATGILTRFVPGFNTNLTGYPYDPKKAKALLEESGVPQPLRLTLWHGLDLDSKMEAQEIWSDLHDIGVEVELKPVTMSELASAMEIRGKVQMAVTGWISGIPDPKDLLGTLFDGRTITNTPTMNSSFYNNPEVNRLLDEAVTNVAFPARYALYQQTEEIIVRDAPAIFLGYPKLIALKQPWVKGQLIEPLWGFRLDRVWIER